MMNLASFRRLGSAVKSTVVFLIASPTSLVASIPLRYSFTRFSLISKPMTFTCFANSTAKMHRKYGLYVAWKEHERVCEKYKLNHPLSYCRMRAQEAVISLLVLDAACPTLDGTQRTEAQAYLKICESHPSKALSLKHRLEWWALTHAPAIAASFGKLSFWADARQQRRKMKKQG